MNTVADNIVSLRPEPVAGQAIGEILVATGRLSLRDAERVAAQQRRQGQKFGEAAIGLKLLTREDLDLALSRQFEYSYLSVRDTSRSAELIAAYQPFSQVAESLRALRSQLMLRWLQTDPAHKAIAVVSAGSGDGRSFIAANLAIVFSQLGQQTLLIDADLRDPRQQELFMPGKSAGLSAVLAGRSGLEAAVAVSGLANLRLMPAGASPPNPQELLGRPAFSALLQDAAVQFDVIVIDTPAGCDYADAEIVARVARAATLVTRKNQSLLSEAASLARRLQDSGVTLVGAVLNDA